jgi:predicted kinase
MKIKILKVRRQTFSCEFFISSLFKMTFSHLILTVGIPGSGKTTWVKNFKRTHGGMVFLSSDEIRDEFGEYDYDEQTVGKRSPLVHEEIRRLIKEKMNSPPPTGSMGWEFVVDATNTEESEWKKFKEMGFTLMSAHVFECDVEEAKRRNKTRKQKVPEYVIDDKFRELEENRPHLPLYFHYINVHPQDEKLL